jgi:hypothetical protein
MTCVESVSSAPLINAMDGYYIWIWVHPYSAMPVQQVGGELSGFWGSRDLSLREQPELDMADSVSPDDVDVFLDNAAWSIRSTYHAELKASPGAAIFGRDMLFDIPFVANWYKIGEHRQLLTDRSTERENKRRIDYDYKVGDKVLVINDGILRKSESKYGKEPWTITTVHTNGTIRVQCGTKSERINIRRVTPYTED